MEQILFVKWKTCLALTPNKHLLRKPQWKWAKLLNRFLCHSSITIFFFFQVITDKGPLHFAVEFKGKQHAFSATYVASAVFKKLRGLFECIHWISCKNCKCLLCWSDIATSHEANLESFDAVITAPPHFESDQLLALRFFRIIWRYALSEFD